MAANPEPNGEHTNDVEPETLTAQSVVNSETEVKERSGDTMSPLPETPMLGFSFVLPVLVPFFIGLMVFSGWNFVNIYFEDTIASISKKMEGVELLRGASSALLAMIVGYMFGAFGAFVRVSYEATINPRYNLISSGILGAVSGLVVQSQVFLRLIYPDISLPAGQSISTIGANFQGIGIITFIVGLFTGETIDAGHKRLGGLVKPKKPDEGEGN
jgi:hypothetical protein